MQTTTSAIVLFAASAFAAIAALPCHAYAAKDGKQAAAGKRADARENLKGQAARNRRNDKEAQKRIVTYNLFQDPVFKLNGALGDKRQLGAPAMQGAQRHPGPPLKQSVAAGATVLKLQEPETSGLDFGCRDKPFRSGASTRELTACYKHNVDRAWKTQTYVSREYNPEGTQKWGGGLAVRYAY